MKYLFSKQCLDLFSPQYLKYSPQSCMMIIPDWAILIGGLGFPNSVISKRLVLLVTRPAWFGCKTLQSYRNYCTEQVQYIWQVSNFLSRKSAQWSPRLVYISIKWLAVTGRFEHRIWQLSVENRCLVHEEAHLVTEDFFDVRTLKIHNKIFT
jgi:hypothetical protein